MTAAPVAQPWPWFPNLDPVGPDAAAPPTSELLTRVADLGADLLAPSAAMSDAAGVPRSHLDALASIGALGRPAEPAEQREIAELIAGSCGTTWFCWTQHRAPTDIVNDSDNLAVVTRWADALTSGTALAGVAFAHVRRPGPPAVRATRDRAGGWVLEGELDWVTSWSIADVVVVVAETDDHKLVRALIEPHEQPGLVADPPMALAAMGGTHTCPVHLRGLRVPADNIASVVDKDEWAARDSMATVNASPHIFGVARAAIALLQQTGEQRNQSQALDVAHALAEQVRDIRREAYAFVDDVPADRFREQRLRLRANALAIAVTATSAAVTARAGGAVRLSDPAQRYAREAMFYLVQAQTPDTRAALLQQFGAQSFTS